MAYFPNPTNHHYYPLNDDGDGNSVARTQIDLVATQKWKTKHEWIERLGLLG
jgi:hypothetical protein